VVRLHGRAPTFALLVALATLVTVLAKTAVLAGRPGLAGPLVAGALLSWLRLLQQARVWMDDDRERLD
jgi:hypothetical protein